MSDQTYSEPNRPGFRSRNPDLIPKVLLRAMFGLAVCSLAIVTASVVSNRDHAGVPRAAPVIEQMTLILEGGGPKAVTVRHANGQIMADLAQGGFVTVVQNGLQTERAKHGIDPMLPVDLVRYANGRLTLIDPETNWSVELGSFGSDNKAAFERLLKN